MNVSSRLCTCDRAYRHEWSLKLKKRPEDIYVPLALQHDYLYGNRKK